MQDTNASGQAREVVQALVLKAVAGAKRSDSNAVWELAFQTYQDLDCQFEPLKQRFLTHVIESGKGPVRVSQYITFSRGTRALRGYAYCLYAGTVKIQAVSQNLSIAALISLCWA